MMSFFGIMKEHFLKHVVCDSGSFLWLPFPELNDPDADMQIWYQLKIISFKKNEIIKVETCRKKFILRRK